MASASESRENIEKMKAERQEILQRAKLAQQKVRESLAKEASLRASKGLMTSQEQMMLRNVEISFKTMNKLVAEIHLTRSKRRKSENEEKLVKRNTAIAEGNLKKLNFQLKQLSKMAKVYEGSYGTALTYIKETMNALGLAPIAGALLRKGK